MIIKSERVSLKHLLTVEALTDQEVMGLIRRGQEFKRGAKWTPAKDQYFVTNLFFENSTRTHKSFEIAEKKLGVDVIEFDTDKSSVQKGETLYDTVLTMSAIGVDAAVIRHGDENYYDELIQSRTIQCSIINGGDGSGQHPTQCLLDLLTIYEEFGSFENLKVAIVGDITHSRVAKSNMQMLKRLGAQVFFSGPETWYDQSFEVYGHYMPLDELIEEVDVMMNTKVFQKKNIINSMD
jgi:aspartate carbamoyltransferase catalytic subunit